tara:strand:- start:3759 stop:3926 length:168 start_codon:yes stop_codon:yes gene_type:complete
MENRLRILEWRLYEYLRQKTSEYAWLRMEEEVVERRLQIGGSRKKGQLTASSASK